MTLKVSLTHFLLLPLATPTSRPQLRSSLQRLAVEAVKHDEIFPPRAIRAPSSIHLTIGVMSLQSEERVTAACDYLKSLNLRTMLDASPIEPSGPPTPAQPLVTTLSGLHCFHRPKQTGSLHALPIPSTPHLYPFAVALSAAFTNAGFLIPSTDPLTLHATLVNTIYTRRSESGKNRWKSGIKKFDARDLITRHTDVEWATDVRIEKVAICEMGARPMLDDEGAVVDCEYKEIASVELP